LATSFINEQEISVTQYALYVELKAKPGKEEELASFLLSGQALVADEPGTIAWFVVRFDKQTFAIFDAFDDEAGRQAHLNGRVAEALMARAGDLVANTLEIRSPHVLADKLPG
jgi:quinol monooxygenase YgiN